MKFAPILLIFLFVAGCSKTVEQTSNTVPTRGKSFTADDIAKLKWLEGTWRGMDGEKPFFERYHFEGSTMVVESLSDETLKTVTETDKFELRNGEFGKFEDNGGSRASSITDDAVQFVPAQPGKGNMFRFERNNPGWRAILEWPAKGDKPAGQKIYNMEPVK